MTRFVALLGSINVGGNRLKMTDLRDAFERAGLANVATVTASGNVLFDDDGSSDTEARLAALLEDGFSIDSFAAVRSTEQLKAALDENPFVDSGEAKLVHTLSLIHI